MRVTGESIFKQLNWAKGILFGSVLLVFLFSATTINNVFSADELGSISVETKVSQNKTKKFPVEILVNVNPISSEEDQRDDSNEKKWIFDDSLDTNYPILKQHTKFSWLTLGQLENKYNNRNSISLFILYHSWKGLLS